ncbi:MAG: 3-oxocholest-4-en-26-oate---CoA ligase [Acidimicrobiaceae bacterium]|jgi:acyl-CoA synthetase (AMP-forming)/AMP-acid ligase II|nr:3-oxocholest-4-en-26-oate---CoA ligase [Acidimicrobiaceae bacterium]
MPGWNFADIWETIADTQPDAPALVHGDRRVTWAEFDARANGVASWLLDLGVARQDKVAHYLYNDNEFLESMFAIFRAGLAPVNTNYRYAEDELLYLWDNADAVAVVFHGTFAERIEVLRNKLPKVKGWLWVDDGSGPCPDWATPYEDAAGAGKAGQNVSGPWGRDGDDLYMLYTGGTTGMPKGVMWRQDDIFGSLNESGGMPYPAEPDYDTVRRLRTEQGPGLRGVPACPLMHGTGAFTSFNILDGGGCVVTLANRTFDPDELLATIESEKVNAVAIVGDAFAKPILRALDANPGKYDISSLMLMVSSGVMWSQETKEGLLRHHAGMLLADAFSSSEALGMGNSVSGGANAAQTAKFSLGDKAIVITDDGRLVQSGSGEVGMVGVRGRTPLGYYKDPEKSAKTFRTIDGVRYSIPGDYATVEADGSLKLLGRGSVCINTGGEKVYPEEVEEALKTHPSIRDAVAVGVPDEKWGEAITAVVELHDGAGLDEADVIAHVKSRLATYKAPKRVLPVDTIGRAPNGKVDYKRLKAQAAARLA